MVKVMVGVSKSYLGFCFIKYVVKSLFFKRLIVFVILLFKFRMMLIFVVCMLKVCCIMFGI